MNPDADTTLTRISDYLAQCYRRPFCPQCYLSRLNEGEVACTHCQSQKAKARESLDRFLQAKAEQGKGGD